MNHGKVSKVNWLAHNSAVPTPRPLRQRPTSFKQTSTSVAESRSLDTLTNEIDLDLTPRRVCFVLINILSKRQTK